MNFILKSKVRIADWGRGENGFNRVFSFKSFLDKVGFIFRVFMRDFNIFDKRVLFK
jgi:hypothetical protein